MRARGDRAASSLAFARPFFRQGARGGRGGRRRARGRRPARPVGEHGLRRSLAARAQTAARKVDRRRSAPSDRATLVLFGTQRRGERARDRRSRRGSTAAIDAAKVGVRRHALRPGAEAGARASSRGRRCRGARSCSSATSRRPAGSGAEDVQLPRGRDAHAGLGRATPRRRTSSVPSVAVRARVVLGRRSASTVTAGLANRGDDAGRRTCRSRSTIDGRDDRDAARRRRGRTRPASVTFAPFTLAERERARRRCAPAPTRCRPTTPSTSSLSPSAAGVGRSSSKPDGAAPTSLYLTKALVDRHDAARSRSTSMPACRVTPAMLRQARRRHPQRRAVPPAAGGGALQALRRARRRPARRRSASARRGRRATADLLPGMLGAPVDRTARPRRHARLPRLQPPGVRGVQGAAQRRLLGRARLPLPRARRPAPTDRVLARFDDGAVGGGGAARRAPAASSRGRRRSTTRGTTSPLQAGVPAARAPARRATWRSYEEPRGVARPSARCSTSPRRSALVREGRRGDRVARASRAASS